MTAMTKANMRQQPSTPSPRGAKRHGRQSSMTKLIVCTCLISFLLLLVFIGDETTTRNLRLNALLEDSISFKLPVQLKEAEEEIEEGAYEDFYHPYDSDYHGDALPHCDAFPLEGGHNVWIDETGESVRLHKHSSTICGPKVLVVGAMKCGTNTLGHLLAKHPRVKLNTCSVARTVNDVDTGCNDVEFQSRGDDIWEGHDLSFRWKMQGEPEGWLEHWTRRLPWTDGKHNITIDKSPSYMNTLEFPNITQDVKRLLPNAKIVVSVCNPALRLYSEYNHNMDQRPEGFLDFYRNKGFDVPIDFPSFIDLLVNPPEEVCQRLPHFCSRNQIFYLKKGEYSTLLKDWYEVFGKDNVLVVDMNDSQRDIATQLLDLVGHEVLPPNEYPWGELQDTEIDFQSAAANYTGRSSAFEKYEEQIVQLEQYYAPFNKELADLIGRDFPMEWNQRIADAYHVAKKKNWKNKKV